MPRSNVAGRTKSSQETKSGNVVRPRWEVLEEHISTGVAAGLADPSAMTASPDELRAAIDRGLVQGLELALQAAADRWCEEVVGADRYERTPTRRGYRSGVRAHRFAFSVGSVTVAVTRPRRGASRPWWVPALKARPQRLLRLVRELWLRGLSLRDISAMSQDLPDTDEVSHSTVGAWVRDVASDVLRWLNRPVRQDIRYLVLDAVYVPVVRQSSRKEPVLVALGITAEGHKEILDVLCAASESADSWGTLISRLKLRGLPVGEIELVITDGDEGLLAAVSTHLPRTRRQRCTVHKVRNVVGRCSRELKKTAPAEAAAIFKAPSRSEAYRRAEAFIAKYEHEAPRLAEVIRGDLDATLAFYDFDAEVWRSLRSTNALERTHRELRRKFREVGAMKAEVNVTRIAVQVAAFLNEQTKDVPIAGFRTRRRR